MGVKSPKERRDADDPEPGTGGFVFKLAAADHLDPGFGPLDPAPERPLGLMQKIGPVERQDEPSGTGTGEFAEGGPPFFGRVEMMEEAQGKNEGESAAEEGQTLGDMGDRPDGIWGDVVLGPGPPDHGQ